MFEAAIEKVSQFTRPLHTISRSFGGLVVPGAATFFFVNDEGVAITCKHIAEMILASDKINKKFSDYKTERDKLVKDNKYNKNLNGLEIKYKLTKDTTIQLKNNFLNSIDNLDTIDIHLHPTLDLAILKFKGFNRLLYSSHASFIKDSKKIRQGKYLCRLGFPFAEFNNFSHNTATDDIEWTNTGNPNSPIFPIDGIITRFLGAPNGNGVTGIEMSTPGLKGQSGGPLFNTEGTIYGMQFATNHLHLGFDLKDREIINEGKKTKVSNYPFLHVGYCIHVDKIKDFLREHAISFTEADA
jgi:hypothetical protein